MAVLTAYRSILTLLIALFPLAQVAEARDRQILDMKTAREIARDNAREYARQLSQNRQNALLVSRFGPRAAGIRYDSRMIRAAQIAEERARKHSVKRCWRYVKTALLEANVIDSYPKTALAKQAAHELTQQHGFRRLPIMDPFKAPVGSVIVYGGRGPGHVEIRTVSGFVSDFESEKPSKRPLIGVFVKPG